MTASKGEHGLYHEIRRLGLYRLGGCSLWRTPQQCFTSGKQSGLQSR